MTQIDGLAVRTLFGFPVHAATMEQTLALCHNAVEHRQRLVIGVLNAAKIVNMRRDSLLRASVLESDLVLADGMAVVWASRLLGEPLPERVAGIDLFVRLLGLGHQHRWSAYFLGAKPEVLDELLKRIREQYPDLRIAGARHGYFSDAEAESVTADIQQSNADLLFVAMSPPRKEVFLARWGPVVGAPVCHGVGGSFDVVAGVTRRAPQLWQRLGLEWLYRVRQEPRRLWRRYLVTNARFAGMLAYAIVVRCLGGCGRPRPIAFSKRVAPVLIASKAPDPQESSGRSQLPFPTPNEEAVIARGLRAIVAGGA